jgi:ATP-dependent Clp protease ATP-binding subunit ClpA
MSDRSTKDARVAVVKAALDEARQRGDRRLGTEHLFLGMLHDPDTLTVRTLDTDLQTARAALDALDRAALAAIGIDVAGLPPTSPIPSRKRPPLTSAARSVLVHAVKEAARTRPRRLTTRQLLTALLACERPDPAADLMAQLGIDRSAARARLDRAET